MLNSTKQEMPSMTEYKGSLFPQYPLGKDILLAELKSDTFWYEMKFKGQDRELILILSPVIKYTYRYGTSTLTNYRAS